MKRLFKKLFPAFYGVLVYATVRLLQDTESGFRFWRRAWQQNALEIGLSMLTGYASLYVINRLWRQQDKPSAAIQFDATTLWRELGYITGFNFCIVNILFTPLAAFTDNGLSWSDFAFINIVPLLYLLIYYGIFRSRKYLDAYVQNKLLVEKLSNDQLETELRFLKAQFHPHFLFNALNTIYFQMDDNISGAKQSVEILSELLRYQLYDQQQKVPVTQELQYLEKFIALQKTRASSRLLLTVNFDKQLTSQPVYPLLFLPLVENAFKYVGGKYELIVTANDTGNKIVFKVVNSLPEQAITSGPDRGIGLDNLKRRLALLYPGKHSLTVGKSEEYFIAELCLME